MKDLIEGRVHLMMGASQLHLSYVRSGKLRALAAANARRLPGWTDVPTFAELGRHGYEHAGGIAVFGPGNMPSGVVQRLNAEFAKILRSPEVVDLLTRAVPTLEVEPSSPEALASLVAAQHEEMGAIVRRIGIRLD